MLGIRLWQLRVFFCFSLFATGCLAEVYKWVDESGKVKFSDRAPSEKNAQDVSDGLQKTNVDHASSKMAVTTVDAKKTEDEKALEESRKKKLELEIGDKCRKMKADIDSIARGDRGSFLDKDGKEVLVLERDRGKKLEEWKSRYKRIGCNRLIPLE